MEDVAAERHSHPVFVDEIFNANGARGLGLFELCHVNVDSIRRKVVDLAEPALAGIRVGVQLAARPPHSVSELPSVSGDHEELLCLELFLLLNAYAAVTLSDLHDRDDDPGHKEDDAKNCNQN